MKTKIKRLVITNSFFGVHSCNGYNFEAKNNDWLQVKTSDDILAPKMVTIIKVHSIISNGYKKKVIVYFYEKDENDKTRI